MIRSSLEREEKLKSNTVHSLDKIDKNYKTAYIAVMYYTTKSFVKEE